jgi:hypothetical protein
MVKKRKYEKRKVYKLPNDIQYIYEFEGTMDSAPIRIIKEGDDEIILWNRYDVFNLIKTIIKDLEDNG